MNLEDAIYDMGQFDDAEQHFFSYTKSVEVFGYGRVQLALLSNQPRLQQSAQYGILSSYP
jgi:hypothetical protein